MDKKEAKRDIASFSTNLKNLMNKPLDNPLATLDRDIQHFIYGRISLLIKHNDEEPVGSLNDVGSVVGAALCNVISAFCQNRIESDEIDKIFSSVRESILYGFDARIPRSTDQTEDEVSSSENLVE